VKYIYLKFYIITVNEKLVTFTLGKDYRKSRYSKNKTTASVGNNTWLCSKPRPLLRIRDGKDDKPQTKVH
jgi:hypothetical protein